MHDLVLAFSKSRGFLCATFVVSLVQASMHSQGSDGKSQNSTSDPESDNFFQEFNCIYFRVYTLGNQYPIPLHLIDDMLLKCIFGFTLFCHTFWKTCTNFLFH